MRHAASSGNFVLLDSQRNHMKLAWKQQYAQTDQPMLQQSQSHRKSLLTTLHSYRHSQSHFEVHFSSFKIRESLTSTRHSVHSSNSDLRLTCKTSANTRQNTQLASLAAQTDPHRSRVIAVLKLTRHALRTNIEHCYVRLCMKKCQSCQLEVTVQLWEQLQSLANSKQKPLYFYHLNGQFIANLSESVAPHERVVMVDVSPKFDLNYSLSIEMLNYAAIVEKHVLEVAPFQPQMQPQSNPQLSRDNQEKLDMIYDWQVIKDPKLYAEKLTQNPEMRMKATEAALPELLQWYGEKFENVPNDKPNDKNPLFESISHYANEVLNLKLLHQASEKVEALPNTRNRHKFRSTPMDNLLEKVKRDSHANRKPSYLEVQQDAIVTKKELLRRLDKKNGPLSEQNIPYLMEKYGINRYEVYNLYNLYKSFEKVSTMRSDHRKVLQKGVDRVTLDEGLKHLNMNAGDQLIRNICYFGDFVNWEQFLKIISISLRKTPSEKLEAILQGISGAADGSLTRNQVSLLIGSSLTKMFDSDQPELQDYFTHMAMKAFDPEQTGRVEVKVLKEKVLEQQGDNMNMVSFLILNS